MTRSIRSAAIALVILGALGAASPASATSFAPLTIEQFTDASTYIVEGRVLEVWTELDPERSVVWTRARVRIDRTLKGPDTPAELVVDSMGGVYGAYEVNVPGMAVFSPDEDVFLFLDRLGDGRLVPASKYVGKYTVRRAPGETERYVRQWEGRSGEVYDARFLPHPAVEHRLYLSDLRERVEARLDAGWDGRPVPGLTVERLREINVSNRVPAPGRTP